MGIKEAESERRTRKNELKRIILDSVKFAGLVSVFIVAPNVVGAMAKLGIIRSPRQKNVVERSCDRLARAGLLAWEGKKLRLTAKGECALRILRARDYSEDKPRHWDRKWRVLVFDIPEYRKGLRDKLRHILQDIGFVRLQDSVWVYPYDCEDLITMIKADFHVGRDVLYMIVDTIEGDIPLKKRFGLS
ncbi:MAG: CRISPR-associated endonuclease Cas2 [bacterium]|nr:CRISPR-associated endonuclease Cas2 [bacterium]